MLRVRIEGQPVSIHPPCKDQPPSRHGRPEHFQRVALDFFPVLHDVCRLHSDSDPESSAHRTIWRLSIRRLTNSTSSRHGDGLWRVEVIGANSHSNHWMSRDGTRRCPVSQVSTSGRVAPRCCRSAGTTRSARRGGGGEGIDRKLEGSWSKQLGQKGRPNGGGKSAPAPSFDEAREICVVRWDAAKGVPLADGPPR
jgi:hypothetical protein